MLKPLPIVLALLVALCASPVLAEDLNNAAHTYWSQTDLSNNTTAPNGWPSDGSMLPNQVEPSARMMMGATKRFWDRANCTVTTTGSSGSYIYTPTNTSYPSSYVNGEVYCFRAHQNSAGNDTLNVNSLGAKNIYKYTNAGAGQIAANDIQTGSSIVVSYDTALNSGIGGFKLLNVAAMSLSGDVTLSGTVATIPANTVTNAKSAQMAANTVKGNFTGATANAADNTMPSCPDSGGQHLNYVAGSGLACGTSSVNASMVLISTQTASNSADLHWTGLGTTYNIHRLICYNLVASTSNVRPELQFGEGSGPTWETSGYWWAGNFTPPNTNPGAQATNSGTMGTVGIYVDLGVTTANTSGSGLSFDATIYNITSTMGGKTYVIFGAAAQVSQGYYSFTGAGGYDADANPKTSIRIMYGGGSITSGVCSLYGILN